MKTHAKPCVTGNCLNSAIRIQPRVGKMPLNSAGGKIYYFQKGERIMKRFAWLLDTLLFLVGILLLITSCTPLY